MQNRAYRLLTTIATPSATQPPRAAAGDPLGVQRGWGLLDEDDNGALPAPPDRNGRHWVRVALSSVLLKYAYKITCQFSSRRA